MPWKSLGVVTITAGTAVRITVNQTDPTARLECYSILVQTVDTNTGFIVGGQSDVKFSPMTNPLFELAKPTANSLPSATAGILTQAEVRLNASDYWLDGSVNSDKAIVSVLSDDP